MRVDKVVRHFAFGYKKVCTLVLEGNNVYILHTGRVSGLRELTKPQENGNKLYGAGTAVFGPIIKKFAEDIAMNEKNITKKGANIVMADHKKNMMFPAKNIRKISYTNSLLRLTIGEKMYTFTIQEHNKGDADLFVKTLKAMR